MDISIIDDFFSQSDILKIKHFFTQPQQLWICQCLNKSNTDLTTDTPFWRKDLNNEPLFFVELKNTIIEGYVYPYPEEFIFYPIDILYISRDTAETLPTP
jgi:hypothetical protein